MTTTVPPQPLLCGAIRSLRGMSSYTVQDLIDEHGQPLVEKIRAKGTADRSQFELEFALINGHQ